MIVFDLCLLYKLVFVLFYYCLAKLPERVDEDVSEAVANSARRQGDYPSHSRKSFRFFPEKTSLHYFEWLQKFSFTSNHLLPPFIKILDPPLTWVWGLGKDVSMDERSMKYTHAHWDALTVTHPQDIVFITGIKPRRDEIFWSMLQI